MAIFAGRMARECTDIDDVLRQINSRLRKLEKSDSEKNEEIGRLNRIIGKKDVEIHSLKAELAEAKSRIKEQEDEAKIIKDKINKFQQILNNPLVDLDGHQITDAAQEQQMREQYSQHIAYLTLQYNDKQDEIDRLKNDPNRKQKAAKTLNDVRDGYNNWKQANNDYNNAQKEYRKAEQDFENAEKEYNKIAADNHYQDTVDKISQFEDATKAIEESNKTLDKQNAALANWPKENVNKIKDLEDFWNFLQTGKTKTWRLRTNKAQEIFDKNKTLWLERHIQNYGMAI